MTTSQWANAVKVLRDYIIRVETPSARGTGFFIPPPPGAKVSAVVTAMHVISHVNEWREPLKLTNVSSGKQVFLDANSVTLDINQQRDMSIIYLTLSPYELPPPKFTVPFLEMGKRLFEGVQIGWLGFPSVAPYNLCFFCGHISAWLERDEAYLVDGVAINGVSGGPAFTLDDKENPIIIGLVTEYRPNVATGNVLPGVSLVRSINPLVQRYAEYQKKISMKVQANPPSESKGGLSSSQPNVEKIGP